MPRAAAILPDLPSIGRESDMQQTPVTFDDVAVYFTEEEWECLHPDQRSLYKEVMSDNYQMILSLTRPDIITNIELGYEPYISSPAPRSLPDFQHSELPEAAHTTALQERSHDTRDESSIGPVGQLKRQRRYPRVNPLRWLKKYKKPKGKSHRLAKRSACFQDDPIAGEESRTPPGGADYGARTEEVTGDRDGEPSEMSPDEDRMETDEENTPQGEHCPSQSDRGTQTGYPPDSEDKPEFEKTLRMGAGNSHVDAAKPGKPVPNPRSDRNRDNRRSSSAMDPPLPKATSVLKEVQSPSPNQGTSGRSSLASSQRKEKHVQFSDRVTTFVFQPQAQETFVGGLADRIKLRSRSPPPPSNSSVAPKVRPSLEPKPVHSSLRAEESKALNAQGSRPDTAQQASAKATTTDKSEEGSRDTKLQNGIKCHKKVKKAEVKVSPSQEKTSSSAPKSPSLTRSRSNLGKKDAGTQVDLFSMEVEEPKPTLPAGLVPSPAYPTDLTLIKSYSCSNCGKTTHWTRLSDQQKANVENSIPYMCKMCSRPRPNVRAVESPGKVPGTRNSQCSKLGKASVSPDKVAGTQNSPPTKCAKLAKAAESTEKVTSSPNSPLVKLSKSGKAMATSDKIDGVQNVPLAKPGSTEKVAAMQSSPLSKFSKSGKAAQSPTNKVDGTQNSPLTKCTKPAKALLPVSPSMKKPYCKLPAETADSSPAAKKQKPDMNLEELSKSLKSSPSHDVQTRESDVGQNKTSSEQQSLHTKKKCVLCRRCAHTCSSEGLTPHQKAVNETPTNQGPSPGPKPSQKLKSVNGTPTNISSPDPKRNTPDKRKATKDLQNGTSEDAEQHPSSGAPAPSDGGEKMKEVCSNCGKHFMTRRKLISVPHTSPAKGRSPLSPGKNKKTGAKSDSASNGLAKPSPKEKKAKSEGPKTPKVAKSQLCTKCGKRLVLHVTPDQDGSGASVNENECVVLPRKKRKRPLAGMEPFKCEECGKIFTRHFSLMQHRFIHTGERPYSCKVCRKSFRDAGYLTVHMRSHTNEKPYSCSECGKAFSQHSALVVHQRTHTDERPFQCKDCGKSFTDRSTFRNHQRIHTGEKPYACSYCGKKFTQQPHMKRHESIHTGDRPFRCRQCGKRFIDRTKLKKHELIHTRWED